MDAKTSLTQVDNLILYERDELEIRCIRLSEQKNS